MNNYKVFIERILSDSPEFMVLEKNNEKYLLFDRFVTSLNEGAMPWLFKVYLENNYKILSEEKITNEIQEKYNDLELKIENLNGNMFFNKELMYAIIKELEEQNQIVFDEDNLLFKLI